MADGKTTSERFQEYRPSKTALFWSCAACVAATMILGFTWGGWVTGGSAGEMASDAAQAARAEVAAVACTNQFMAQPDAAAQLAALKDTSTWQRENFIEDGGWDKVAGQRYDDAADLCAEQLVKMEAPSVQEAATNETGTVAQ